MRQTSARFGAFRLAFLVTLVLLVVQYVLGMIAHAMRNELLTCSEQG